MCYTKNKLISALIDKALIRIVYYDEKYLQFIRKAITGKDEAMGAKLRVKSKIWTLCIAIIVMAMLCCASVAGAAGVKTVRVGFYESEFNKTSPNGHLSGYAYDFQQDLKNYTGWKYEYVRADWPELVEMLKEGKIDLMSNVSVTEERLNKMLYSAVPMGAEKFYIYVSDKNKEITSDNYRGLQGKKIGVNAGCVQVGLFKDWARRHGVQVQLLELPGNMVLDKMMAEGELDGIVGVDTYRYHNVVPVVKVGESQFYFVVNKNRPDLKEELDAAMGKILFQNRYYIEYMHKKYLNTLASARLTTDEQEWLQEKGTIRVGYLNNYLGYSGQNKQTGKLEGSLGTFVEKAKSSFINGKLNLEAVGFATEAEELEALRKGEVDCIFPVYTCRYNAEKYGYLLSQSIYSTSVTALVTGNKFSETNKNLVAVNKNRLERIVYVSNNYPEWRIKEYDTDEECIAALRRGEVDCTIFSSYAINNIISPRSYGELQAVALNSEMELSFAVNPENVMLLSILDRAIDLVPRADLNSSLSYFSTPNERKLSFMDYMKENAGIVISVILLFTSAIVGTVLFLLKRAKEAERQARIALQTAEHASKAKTTFLNSMSHDIRTPMNAIIGFTSLAAVHLDDKRLLENYLKKIMTSSNHLLSLINDVLDMSRIESGRIKIEEIECNLPNIMHDLRNILQSDVKAKHLNFLFDTLDVRDDDVLCDKLRLSQIILNCMSNAIKFTKPGGTVGIKIVQRESNKEGYALYDFIISDTGIGMSEEFQKHVFEPFTREETSTVSGIQGTGLGMSITKNIVDMMGGSISVKSVQGQGTEFTISLSMRTLHKQKRITVIRSLKGMRALVADDNMDSCVSVCRLLEKVGMSAEWTMSGVEAVYKAKFAHEDGKSYKAFIIDWLMPDMNGIEVVRRIRGVIGNDTPIIILTAYDWSEIEQEAREAGVTAFCAKPLFLSDLYEVLNRHIEVEHKEPTLQQEKKEDFSHARVLLVEDNDLNREIGRAMLQSFNVNVEEAENGRVAVEMVATSQPHYYDLVLMDIQMPVMNGYEAAREILALKREDVKKLPIVAVSANAFKEDMDKSLEAGMVAHLSKPFTKQMLEEMLEKYLKM